jgi:hypothetical protein
MPPEKNMEQETGIEPSKSCTQKSNNLHPSVAQNPAQSNTSKDNDSPSDDKTITPPGQEKCTFLHSKCVTGVHQNSPELDIVIKAWPDLSEKAKKKIMAMVAQVKRGQ